VGKNNVRLNFDVNPNGTTLNGAPHHAVSGSLGSFTAFEPGDTTVSYAARIDWGNGAFSTATLTPDASGGLDVNGSNTYARAGTYAVRVLITHLDDGLTRALNATTVLGRSSTHPKVG
jgi:hypothetical protein